MCAGAQNGEILPNTAEEEINFYLEKNASLKVLDVVWMFLAVTAEPLFTNYISTAFDPEGKGMLPVWKAAPKPSLFEFHSIFCLNQMQLACSANSFGTGYCS